jgi:hypothetical protein
MADYETVTVSAGGHHSVSLGSGDTLENVLIDISADGATFDINADGAGWEIRNVGIKGVWDQYEKEEPVTLAADAGSTGVVDNFYFADGCPDDTYAGVTGIYVYKHHAGTVRINNVNIQDMPDNAIYASTPGRPSDPNHSWDNGAGGVVEITNSYAADCQASHFRLGSQGSFVKNSVAVGGAGGHRGVLGRFNDTKTIDCDFSGHDFGDVCCGSHSWEDSTNATVTVENCRFGTTDPPDGNMSYTGTIVGSSAGTPLRTSPDEVDGVPLSAEEAASGETAGSNPDGDSDLVAFIATIDADSATYEMTVDGEIVGTDAGYDSPSGNHIRAEDNDEITANGDGTYTVSGVTGNGYGDAFDIYGPVVDVSLGSPELWIELNGENVSEQELIDQTGSGVDTTSTLELTGTSAATCEYVLDVERDPDAPSDAEFSVDHGGNADPNAGDQSDAVYVTDSGYRIHGWVGNGGGDDYLVDAGQITAGTFHSGSADVTVDDETLDVGALGDPVDSPGTPAAPTGLQVTSRGETQISLAWDHGGQYTDYYRVARDGTTVATPTTTSATIDGLTAGTDYDTAVVAVNNHDRGIATSSAATATVMTGVSVRNSPRRTANGIATTSGGIHAARQINDGDQALIDGFERTSLGYSGGDTGAFATTTAAAVSGDRGLTRTSPDDPDNAWMAATDPDPVDGISQGDTVQYRIWSETGIDSDWSAQLGVAFGFADPAAARQDNYYIPLRPESTHNEVAIGRSVGGQHEMIAAVENIDYPGGEWWTIRVTWRTDDVIAVEVFDANGDSVGSTSAYDDTHSDNSGTIGWFGWLPNDADVFVDDLELL